MKKAYYIVLTVLTVVLLLFLTFAKLNEITNWVDFSGVETLIDYLWSIGPIVLLCLYAFGDLLTKMLAGKIIFVVLLLILIIFGICTFAPDLISSIFGA